MLFVYKSVTFHNVLLIIISDIVFPFFTCLKKKRGKKRRRKGEKKQEETEGEKRKESKKRKRNYSLRMPNPPNKLESASPPSFVGIFISVCSLSLLS